ncbi:periplasmic protein, partial [Paracoccus sp. S4493]
ATRVGDGAVCLSACPYILAGGATRQVAAGGVVGVHQHYFGQNTILPAFMAVSDLQRAQAGVMDYLVRMGVDLRLMTYALRTPPAEINVLEPELMAELGLTTPAEG